MPKSIKTNVPGMKILIPDELNTPAGGVYKIVFKDGQFYVGVSSNLRKRIMEHISVFRKDFNYNGCMKCMKGYTGTVKFVLVSLCEDVLERIAIERKIMRQRSRKRINMTSHPGGTLLAWRYPYLSPKKKGD